jgi:hypothetical protein
MHSASVMNNEIYFYNFYYNEIDPLQTSLSFPITYEEGLIIYISTFLSLGIKFYLFILIIVVLEKHLDIGLLLNFTIIYFLYHIIK